MLHNIDLFIFLLNQDWKSIVKFNLAISSSSSFIAVVLQIKLAPLHHFALSNKHIFAIISMIIIFKRLLRNDRSDAEKSRKNFLCIITMRIASLLLLLDAQKDTDFLVWWKAWFFFRQSRCWFGFIVVSIKCNSEYTHTHKQIERKVFRFLTSNQDVVTLNLDSETESRIAQFAPTNTKIQS